MKRINIFAAALIMMVAASSCENENNVLQTVETPTVENLDIPTFATQADFDNALQEVSKMDLPQLQAYEAQKGYTSLGRICDEFYEKINPEQFNTQEEMLAFIEENSKYIQLYESGGDLYCETRDYSNAKRYLMNEDRMYIIADSLYKEPDNKAESITKTSNFIPMQKAPTVGLETTINSDKKKAEFRRTIKVGRDHYRLYVGLEASDQIYKRGYSMQIKNYARSLGVWWMKTYLFGGGEIRMETSNQANYNTCYILTLRMGDVDIWNEHWGLSVPEGNADHYFTKIKINVVSYFKNNTLAIIDVTKTY